MVSFRRRKPFTVWSAAARRLISCCLRSPRKNCGLCFSVGKNNPYFAPRWRALPVTGRLSGRGSTLSPETLLALAPDVIVDSGLTDDTYRSQAARFSRQTGIPYILLSGNLTQTPDLLRQAGALLGKQNARNNRHSWRRNG